MRHLWLALICLTVSTPAMAQVAEVGGGIGPGCTGDSIGCAYDTRSMWSAHASIWMDDRLEVGVRIATLPRPDWNYSVARDDRFNVAADPAARLLPRIDVAVRDRSRRILTVEALYHFAPGRPVRPFAGVGLGDRADRSDQACAPAGCESLMPILSSGLGRQTSHGDNLTAITGVSARFRKVLQVRGALRFHNFAGESLSTTEATIAVGYRFGRR
jgi:hypothetical protein